MGGGTGDARLEGPPCGAWVSPPLRRASTPGLTHPGQPPFLLPGPFAVWIKREKADVKCAERKET